MFLIKSKVIVFILSLFFIMKIIHADDTARKEQFVLSKQLKESIMSSPFKVSLRRSDGKKIIAYLHAEDEKNESEEYSSCDGEEYKTIAKKGHYYIYLYDISTDKFFPNRMAVFYNYDGIKMNTQGASFFVWLNANKNQSDVILISQFVACNGDQYEAYGFIGNELKKYTFSGEKKYNGFYGRIDRDQLKKHSKNLLAYSIYDEKIHQIQLSMSKISGEIKLNTLVVSSFPQL